VKAVYFDGERWVVRLLRELIPRAPRPGPVLLKLLEAPEWELRSVAVSKRIAACIRALTH